MATLISTVMLSKPLDHALSVVGQNRNQGLDEIVQPFIFRAGMLNGFAVHHAVDVTLPDELVALSKTTDNIRDIPSESKQTSSPGAELSM
jgi:hypothetical protein